MSKIISIKKIDDLKELSFKIPFYQRPYAWDIDEVKTLFEDLQNSENEYYVGNIVVDSDYNVIDGQQRLTTLYLMLCVFDKKRLFELSYDIRQKDDDFLKSLKIDVSELKLQECQNHNIKQNLIYLQKQILPDLDKICFTITKLPKDTDITKYYELINTRGIQLEKHHIVKAKILDILKDDKDINWALAWDYCSNMDVYLEDILAYVEKDKKIGKIREELLNFLKDKKLPKVFKENVSCSNFSTIKQSLKEDELDKNSAEINISAIKEYKSILKFDYFLLNVLKMMCPQTQMNDIKLIENFNNFLLNNACKVKDFMLSLLRYRIIFDYFIFKRDISESKDRPYIKDIYSEVENTKNLIMIELLFNLTSPNYRSQEWIRFVFEFVDEELKDKNEINQLIEKLNKMDDWIFVNRVKKKSEIYTQTNEQVCFDDLEILDQGTKTPHYFFYRLEYLLWKENKKEYENFYLTSVNSVEHIYPRSKEQDFSNNEKDIDIFGNLALITSSRNSSLSDKDVDI